MAKQKTPRAGAKRQAARPRRRPASYHHGNLRAVLLDVAVEMLEEGGAPGLSLRAIARRAGVSPNAPYNHFADKEALLAAVAAEGFVKLRQSMMSAVEAERSATTGARIRALGRGYLHFALAWPEHLRLMFGREIVNRAAHPALGEAGMAAYEPISKAVEAFMAESQAGRRTRMAPGIVTVAAWSLVHGLAVLLTDHKIDPADTGARTQDELIDHVLEVFAGALTAKR